MKKNKNHVWLAILLLLLCVSGVEAFEVGEGRDTGYTYQNWDVHVEVGTDRTYHVTETLDVWFSSPSHGILRTIPTAGSAEKYRITDLRAEGTPWKQLSEGEIRIGDPAKRVVGARRYVISYNLVHYADPETDFDYLYFNPVGTEVDTVINSFKATIVLPAGAAVRKCDVTSGTRGSRSNEYADYSVDGNVIVLTGRKPLPPYRGVTVNAALDEGTFRDALVYVPSLSVSDLCVSVDMDQYGTCRVTERYKAVLNKTPFVFSRLLYREWTGQQAQLNCRQMQLNVAGGGGGLMRHGNVKGAFEFPFGGKGAQGPLELTLTYVVHYDPFREKGLPLRFIFGNGGDVHYDKITVDMKMPFTPDRCKVVADGGAAGGENWLVKTGRGSLHFETKKRLLGTSVTLTPVFNKFPFVRKTKPIDVLLPLFACAYFVIAWGAMFFRRHQHIVPVIGFYPPEQMNPAEAGYLIDGKTDTRDITALIFYWASLGALDIELQDDDDFVLHSLTDISDRDEYERSMFVRMFRCGDGMVVTGKQLAERFHKDIIEDVRIAIKEKYSGAKAREERFSKAVIKPVVNLLLPLIIVVLAAVTVLMTGAFDENVMSGMLIVLLPALACHSISSSQQANQFKLGLKRFRSVSWVIVAVVLASVLSSACLALLFGGMELAWWSLVLVSTLTMTAFAMAPRCVSFTEYSVAVLGQLVGFREFLQTAEKDRLEKLLAENPDYFYDTLPFAQVLGVSDIWKSKFDQVALPKWLHEKSGVDLLDGISMINDIGNRINSSVFVAPVKSNGSGFSIGDIFSGGGGFSGGGSSGGGSGGGGSSRW